MSGNEADIFGKAIGNFHQSGSPSRSGRGLGVRLHGSFATHELSGQSFRCSPVVDSHKEQNLESRAKLAL